MTEVILFQADVKVKSQRKLRDDYFILECESPAIARKAMPGQFVHIHCPGSGAFFRRPFSIAGTTQKTFSMLIKKIGPGTDYLSRRIKGDVLDIMGPLGSFYPVPGNKDNIIFIAGGSGIASLNFLAEKIHPRKGVLFYGAGDKDEIMLNEFRKFRDWDVRIATDNGSRGFRGFVSSLFFSAARKPLSDNSVVYVCGPNVMEKALAQRLADESRRFFVSMEAVMACGVGACRGCAVKLKNTGGYKMVCKDGPVFDGSEIDWQVI